MKKLLTLIQVTTVGALLAPSAGSLTAIAADHPGEFGEFRYWHHGKCEDARLKASDKPWAASVF